MRYLSLFSGIGAFEKALSRIGIEYELVGFSEIDKYAIKSYCAVHGVDESLNLGDISKIDLDKLPSGIDLITHGSPCQDFSIAGKLAGGDKGSGTRSSLMWCTVDIVEKTRPKYVIWENVKNVLSAKNRHNFDGYIQVMEDLGYTSYYQVLNAKNYGIPQNRERVFTVSIRKDLDIKFEFPKEIELKLKLKDMLEETVDDKYYLSDKLLSGLIANTERQKEKGNGFAFEPTDGKGLAKTITTRAGACRTGDNYIEVVGNLDIKGHDCVKRVYGVDGISPTLTDMQGGNRQPKIITYDVTQIVKVRKYNVDTEKLVKVLREHKERLHITNRQLAEELDIPMTQIEHYFRQDSSFAIPEPNLWYKLKELLKIEANEFDESIMTFEEKEGVYEKANRIYDEQGLAPTLTLQESVAVTVRNDKQPKIMTVGNYMPSKHDASRIVDEDGIAPTVKENHGTVTAVAMRGRNKQPKIVVDEPVIAASRGRNPENPSDRTPGAPTEQRLEINKQGISNTITTVQKDNYVIEPCLKIKEATKTGYKEAYEGDGINISGRMKYQRGNVQKEMTQTLMATGSERGVVTPDMRIRKLTPRECWRLMGFDDEDFDKAEAVPTSNTQLYKQAGNSIVVNVLEAIFKNLFLSGGD